MASQVRHAIYIYAMILELGTHAMLVESVWQAVVNALKHTVVQVVKGDPAQAKIYLL